MANSTLRSLEAALDRAVAVAIEAQEARDAARARAGRSKAPPAFLTAAQMVSELCAAHDRHRAETRGIVAAVVADCRHKFDPDFKPDAFHKALIELTASIGGNVVPLHAGKAARQIFEAGRKRRGG